MAVDLGPSSINIRSHVAGQDGRLRSQDPGGSLGSPIVFPTTALFLGDSQTDGRSPNVTASSHAVAFENVWNDNFTPFSTFAVQGSGGRSLAGTMAEYDSRTHAADEWFHFQESGNQDLDGQRTPAEFGVTFRDACRNAATESPSGLISTETACNFSRGGDPFRNWDDYNAEMLASVSILQAEGIIVRVVDVRAIIDYLIGVLGYEYIEEDTAANHFGDMANLAVALGIFARFGINPTGLDLASISVSVSDKTHALNAVLSRYPF